MYADIEQSILEAKVMTTDNCFANKCWQLHERRLSRVYRGVAVA